MAFKKNCIYHSKVIEPKTTGQSVINFAQFCTILLFTVPAIKFFVKLLKPIYLMKRENHCALSNVHVYIGFFFVCKQNATVAMALFHITETVTHFK